MFILRNHQKREETYYADYSCKWTNITTCNIYDYTFKLTKGYDFEFGIPK